MIERLITPMTLAPLAVGAPVLGACLLLVAGRLLPQRLAPIAADAVAVVVAGAGVVLDATLLATGGGVTVLGGWPPEIGIVLVADRTAAGAALLAAVLTVVALVFGWRYLDAGRARLPALMLLFLAGMTGFVYSGDLFDMLVFFELMGVAAYALAGFRIEEPSAVQGGLTFGVVTSLGAYLMLCGIALLYGRTGELGLARLGTALATGPADALVTVAFALVATGLLVKTAAVPFHFWLEDAHAVAPTPVCVLLSGVMVELGLYGAMRVSVVVFGGVLDAAAVQRVLLVLGAAAAVVGTVMCPLQRHIKRLLAYSTIAHVGTFLMAAATLSATGLGGAIVAVLGHAGIKGALFLAAGIVLNRYGSIDEPALHGRGRGAHLLAGLVVLAGLALAGLPPFGTALGKALADEAVAPWAIVLMTVVPVVTGASVLRAAARIFFGAGVAPDDEGDRDVTTGAEHAETASLLHGVPWTMYGATVVLLIGGLAVGVLPGTAATVAGTAAQLLDGPGYAHAVAAGSAVPVPSVPETGWTVSGIGLGLLSAALAVALAAVMLGRPAPTAAIRARVVRARPIAAPAVALARRLHSGHIGDYVAWLLAGTVAIGLLAAA